jgi:hypothetical protein
MRDRYLGLLMTVAIAVAAFDAATSVAMAQAPQIVRPPARIEGKPNFSGIWQANNEANWDLQAHAARPAAITQQGVYPYEYARVPAAPVLALGAAGAVPGSLGVVQGDGQVPYKPEALATKKENQEHWINRDPSSSAICRAFRARCTCPTRSRSRRAPTRSTSLSNSPTPRARSTWTRSKGRRTTPGWATRSDVRDHIFAPCELASGSTDGNDEIAHAAVAAGGSKDDFVLDGQGRRGKLKLTLAVIGKPLPSCAGPALPQP